MYNNILIYHTFFICFFNFFNLFVPLLQGLHQFRSTVLPGVPGYIHHTDYTYIYTTINSLGIKNIINLFRSILIFNIVCLLIKHISIVLSDNFKKYLNIQFLNLNVQIKRNLFSLKRLMEDMKQHVSLSPHRLMEDMKRHVPLSPHRLMEDMKRHVPLSPHSTYKKNIVQ